MAPDAEAAVDGRDGRGDGGNGDGDGRGRPTPRSSRAALLAALSVRRYARLSLAVGAAVAVGVFLLFPVVLAGGQPTRPAPLYLALAFVVLVTTALLALAVLVGRRVLRLAVHPGSIVRRGATVGLAAGALWLVVAVALQLGPAPLWGGVVDLAVPWAAFLTPVGIWAVYTRYKRVGAGRAVPGIALVAPIAAVAAVAGALVVADLAAFDLLGLLPDVGGGVDESTARLFLGGVAALVAGHVALAGLARLAERRVGMPLAIGALPAAGLAGYLVAGPSRLGLGALAAGFGCCWLVVGWRLRRVPDAAVPAGPPADLAVE